MKYVTTLAMTLLITSNSFAASNSNNDIASIQAKQTISIQAGVKNGNLTPKEEKSLRSIVNAANTKIANMRKSNGDFSVVETKQAFELLAKVQTRINKSLRNMIKSAGR